MGLAVPWDSLTPAVFRSWLGRHGQNVPVPWARVKVGLGLLDPVADSLVVRGLKGEKTVRELAELHKYFERVDDAATKALMVEFYKNLIEKNMLLPRQKN